MPYVLGVLGLIFAAYFWAMRLRNAGLMANELAGMAGDVMAAARRFGFRRRLNTHPVDCTDDAQVITGAAAIAFLELGGLPSAEDQNAAIAAIGRHLNRDLESSRELAILGRWLVHECSGPVSAIPRLTRRLMKLSGAQGLFPLMAILKDIGARGDGALSTRQKEALEEISRTFKLA